MATIELTTSSQLKSANAESEIKHHTGKANRKIFNHENKEIDLERSDWNVEFNPLSRDELLQEHYGERIEKHNKTNRGESRRWDMEKFLKTIQNKPVMLNGKDTGNREWETLCQITYVGDKETMGRDGELWTLLMKAGVPEAKIRDSYTKGYEEYIKEHNETFPTLPIYHSDIHFDETTPHGHDAIIPMGHTPKGRASSTLNNALGEKYGYETSMDGKKANLAAYRDENDEIAFRCISGALEELAEAYNVDVTFEAVRTGQDFSLDVPNYKRIKDEVQEEEAKLSEREAKLEERISEAEKREAALAQQEADFRNRDARLKKQEEELAKKNNNLNEKFINEFRAGAINALELVNFLKDGNTITSALKVVDANLAMDYAIARLPLKEPTLQERFKVAAPLLNAKVNSLKTPKAPPTQTDHSDALEL